MRKTKEARTNDEVQSGVNEIFSEGKTVRSVDGSNTRRQFLPRTKWCPYKSSEAMLAFQPFEDRNCHLEPVSWIPN